MINLLRDKPGSSHRYIALPERFIFVPFGLVGGRLYCNTLLATLNAQKSMGRDGSHVVEFGTQVLNDLNSATAGDGSNRSSTRGKQKSASDGTSMPTFVLDIDTKEPVGAVHPPAIYNIHGA
ncbi:hypothetical protein GSI_02864 [Ganoderma sinense ZZ0214-1]|uniref:Uncharacterized protein n=1 Tax=Ganoderma sinense ZZ0214-1 TaxID=1077348 RepID=A0A2G8SMS9_9APHY|nr:hypothetical protein GSI_02864 [Ganoderma sinense ZZ0214-1]